MSRLNTLLFNKIGNYAGETSGTCYILIPPREKYKNICRIIDLTINCEQCHWLHKHSIQDWLLEIFGSDAPKLTYEPHDTEKKRILRYEQTKEI